MSLSKPRVLLLTDDLMQATLIKMVLNSSNIDVTMAFSHAEMISALDIALPDVILADWDSERLNGRAIISELRTVVYGLERVPAILMTGHKVNEVARLDMTVEGFRWVLQTPVVVTSLPKLIEHTIGESRVRKNRPSATQYVHFGETASSAFMEAVN